MTEPVLAPTASLHLSALGANQLQSGVFPCPSQEASPALSTFLTGAVIYPDVCEGEDSERSLLHYLLQTFPFLWQMLPTPPTAQLGQGEDVNIYGAGRYDLQCGHGKGTDSHCPWTSSLNCQRSSASSCMPLNEQKLSYNCLANASF